MEASEIKEGYTVEQQMATPNKIALMESFVGRRPWDGPDPDPDFYPDLMI